MNRSLLFKLFPAPKFLDIHATGVDLSDDAIRFIELKKTSGGLRVARFGEHQIPEPLVGVDPLESRGFEGLLSSFKQESGLDFINVSLPESKAYLFRVDLPVVRHSEIRPMITYRLEEFVPVPVAEAVFDYEIIARPKSKNLNLSVTVMPSRVIHSYLGLFKNAGFHPLAFKMEGQAIARAVISKNDPRTLLIVNFGETRTTLFIATCGVVEFSSTVSSGSASLVEAI